MNDERLAFILRAPALVERVVRGALREALRSRPYQSGELDVRTFANAALSELERLTDITRPNIDPSGRLELQNATVSAAGCFASSALARRLFAVPVERFRRAPPETDAAVTDARGRLHVVRLELVTNAAARTELARSITRSIAPTLVATNRAQLPQIHLLSVRDGRLRSWNEGGVHATAPAIASTRGETQRHAS